MAILFIHSTHEYAIRSIKISYRSCHAALRIMVIPLLLTFASLAGKQLLPPRISSSHPGAPCRNSVFMTVARIKFSCCSTWPDKYSDPLSRKLTDSRSPAAIVVWPPVLLASFLHRRVHTLRWRAWKIPSDRCNSSIMLARLKLGYAVAPRGQYPYLMKFTLCKPVTIKVIRI